MSITLWKYKQTKGTSKSTESTSRVLGDTPEVTGMDGLELLDHFSSMQTIYER